MIKNDFQPQINGMNADGRQDKEWLFSLRRSGGGRPRTQGPQFIGGSLLKPNIPHGNPSLPFF
jgi:hypothetical protein